MSAGYDDPTALAALVRDLPPPRLLGLDVDGVLAPIVRHAAEARLAAGVGAVLSRLAAEDGWRVVVVSGRSLDDLARFGFPAGLTVVGSHGMETADAPLELTPAETERFDRLGVLARHAVDAAGHGAWLEAKPASVTVHVREADAARGRRALAELEEAVGEVEGATSIAGSEVLELFARTAGKGEALRSLRGQFSAASTIFVGDDITDEHAFAVLGPGDVAIKVGDAPTVAAHRLRDPEAVVEWLRALLHGDRPGS